MTSRVSLAVCLALIPGVSHADIDWRSRLGYARADVDISFGDSQAAASDKIVGGTLGGVQASVTANLKGGWFVDAESQTSSGDGNVDPLNYRGLTAVDTDSSLDRRVLTLAAGRYIGNLKTYGGYRLSRINFDVLHAAGVSDQAFDARGWLAGAGYAFGGTGLSISGEVALLDGRYEFSGVSRGVIKSDTAWQGLLSIRYTWWATRAWGVSAGWTLDMINFESSDFGAGADNFRQTVSGPVLAVAYHF